jgi:hypothetical protein
VRVYWKRITDAKGLHFFQHIVINKLLIEETVQHKIIKHNFLSKTVRE